MASSLVLQGIIAALCAVLGAVLWRLVPYLLAPFRSSLLNLPGPPSPGWLFGSINEIYESDGDLITDEWIEKYGPTIMYRGIFNVGSSSFRRHIVAHKKDVCFRCLVSSPRIPVL